MAGSGIDRAVAIVRLRGLSPPRPLSPPAAAASSPMDHVTGIIRMAGVVREASSPRSSAATAAAGASGIDPAGHGIELIRWIESLEKDLGTTTDGWSRRRSVVDEDDEKD